MIGYRAAMPKALPVTPPPPMARDARGSTSPGVAPGDVLGGKYLVERVLGTGGMGVVVEAVRRDLGERVAVKVMHDRYTSNAEAMARFQQEARAAVKIRGENSARILDVGTTEAGAPFIVMELLLGCDLATLLKEGPLPVEEAVLYVIQACEGMAEVHAHGIVHRDLKPGNLFLTRRPDGSPLVKVLDFGIAKSASPADALEPAITMTLVSLGTPLYMSPEQVRCSKTVDNRSDVWALGAILYELLSGLPAFGGNSVANISAQVLEATPAALPMVRPGVPPKLDKVVQKALAKRPEHRYSDVGALAAALAPFAGPTGAAHAERALRIARGDGLGAVTGPIPSVRPGPTNHAHSEAATTLRFVHKRDRLLRVAVAALAVVALGLGVAVVRTYRQGGAIAVSAPAQKGVGASSAVRFAVVLTAARVGAAASPEAGATATPITVDELPPARARRGRPAARPAGALDPLETRK